MPPVGFEPTISAGERPKTYALDRAVITTGNYLLDSNRIVSGLLDCRVGSEWDTLHNVSYVCRLYSHVET
jgi:hypothetical protein